jgi:hypothetical protein
MAQGKRAGLITPRSSDRNGLPVKSLLGSPPDSDNFQPTPLAQRQSAGLITREVTGSKPVGGIKPTWRRGSAQGS